MGLNTLLEIRNINVFYDQFHVLHDVSLSVAEGEAVGLIGPNGHGKSTLMKALCGLLPVRAGDIAFKGESITRLNAPKLVERGLVYVAEERHLFNDMTVRENLLLGAFLPRGATKKAGNLELVFELYPRLAERRDQLARTLSGGEAQMLALGRGLMSAADFMAIDEPSLGLAPNLVAEMLATIQRINQEAGITVLLVEQNTSQLKDFVHRVYVMEDGQIRSQGALGDLLAAKPGATRQEAGDAANI